MHKMIQRITNRKGFTLVELMIVVAIIGILAAIAIPAFLRSVKKSKTSEAESIMRKITDGAKGYFTSEQRFSQLQADGGEQPWHIGVATPGVINTYGMPVAWPGYVFPGGAAHQFNTGLAAADTGNGRGSCAISPTGGAKQLGFDGPTTQPLPTHLLNATLNRLGVSFPDQYYFTYDYDSLGLAQAAVMTTRALANFKEDPAVCHTITQTVSVNPDSQEVQIGPANTTFEFE